VHKQPDDLRCCCCCCCALSLCFLAIDCSSPWTAVRKTDPRCGRLQETGRCSQMCGRDDASCHDSDEVSLILFDQCYLLKVYDVTESSVRTTASVVEVHNRKIMCTSSLVIYLAAAVAAAAVPCRYAFKQKQSTASVRGLLYNKLFRCCGRLQETGRCPQMSRQDCAARFERRMHWQGIFECIRGRSSRHDTTSWYGCQPLFHFYQLCLVLLEIYEEPYCCRES
jgi:hypothetical protein